jgi:hypothetical protein
MSDQFWETIIHEPFHNHSLFGPGHKGRNKRGPTGRFDRAVRIQVENFYRSYPEYRP